MESDEGTTWYRPTQLFHVVAGADLGWRSGWAKWPKYFIDTLPPISDTGRGSPAGMTFYEHHAYPEKYRGTLFTCDWTGGQILVTKCDSKDAGYTAASTTFLKGQPLNATDIEVGPDGWLYFSTGGRGTRGSIYRVVWKGTNADSVATSNKTIDSVLKQPQPQSAWARQKIAITKKSLGTKWSSELRDALLGSKRSIRERVSGFANHVAAWAAAFGKVSDQRFARPSASSSSPGCQVDCVFQSYPFTGVDFSVEAPY